MSNQFQAVTVPEFVTFIQDFFDWAEKVHTPQQTAQVHFTLTSNETDGLSSYSEGRLVYQPGKHVNLGKIHGFLPPQFNSPDDSEQLLSELESPKDHGPFDPDRVDEIRLAVMLNGTLTVSIRHKSSHAAAGDADQQFVFGADVKAGVLYGAGKSIKSGSRQALYTISFRDKAVIPLVVPPPGH